MDDNKKEVSGEKKKNARKEIKYFLKLAAVVVLASGGALLSRQSGGIVAMLPFIAPIGFIAAFFDIEYLVSGAAFGVCAFIFNTAENGLKYSLIAAVIAVFAVIIPKFGINVFRSGSKKAGAAIAAAGIVAVCAGVMLIAGNPVTALEREKALDAYIESVYPDRGEGLGDITFSKIYYDSDLDIYCKDAAASAYPAETARISVNKAGITNDGFVKIIEADLAENARDSLVEILRGEFPDGRFTVRVTGVSGFPTRALIENFGAGAKRCVNYEITVGGVQTAAQFRKEAEKLVSALDGTGAEYNNIVFVSGIGAWYRMTAEVTMSDHPKGLFKAEPRLMRINTGRLFADHIKKTCVLPETSLTSE